MKYRVTVTFILEDDLTESENTAALQVAFALGTLGERFRTYNITGLDIAQIEAIAVKDKDV